MKFAPQILFLLSACDAQLVPEVDDLGTTADLLTAADESTPHTAHPALPQVTNLGGSILATPQVWTVVWPGDETLGHTTADFIDALLHSSYWQSLSEYGIAAGAGRGTIVVPTTAPATLEDSSLATLADDLGSKQMFDNETLLVFIIPAGTMLTVLGQVGCKTFYGSHMESMGQLPFVIVPQCPQGTLTTTLSHEIAEAATDPHDFTGRAFVSPSVGEIADLCQVLAPAQVSLMTSNGPQTYPLARLYSNAIAQMGMSDPCVPAPASVYFNVALDPPQPQLSPGQTAQAWFVPYAFGEVGTISWKVTSLVPGIVFTPNTGSAVAGDRVAVKIAAAADAMGGGPYVITAHAGNDNNAWYDGVTIGD
jgi:hypothetical protein